MKSKGKKVLPLSLCFAMAISMLAGCGRSSSSGSASGSTVKSASTVSSTASTTGSASASEASEAASSASTTAAEETDDGPVDAGISVKKIDNLSSDFINGVDVSSYLSEIKSGAKYYDFDGNEANLFDILQEAGVNYVRLRVWNCPYAVDDSGNIKYVDDNGKEYSAGDVTASTGDEGYTVYALSDGTEVNPEGYGAGNCDVDNAAYIGKLATDHGMKVLIDFHYSDFWADPNKQKAPKAWTDMTPSEKAEAGAKFTTESLNTLKDAGVDVGMVQIGNEINNGCAGMNQDSDVFPFLSACAKAVRAVDPDILIAVHYTDPQKEGYQYGRVKDLVAAGVDFDVFATSYYPFWHGSADTLATNLKKIAGTFNKKVMVAEVSYAFTTEDGDGYGVIVSGQAGDQTYNYPITPEGQAQAIRDAMAAVASVGKMGLGTFYWEPAWLPVDKSTWNKYGSGWASKYAKGYDPEVHDDENGCTWDNQAYFDYTGKALESLKVYQYVKTGSSGPVNVKNIDTLTAQTKYHESTDLPTQTTVHLTDGTNVQVNVVWPDDVADTIKAADFGTTTVTGDIDAFSYDSKGESISVEKGKFTTTCEVTVIGDNFITNGDFEDNDGDGSGWTVKNYDTNGGGAPKVDVSTDNAHHGQYYYTGWDEKSIDFEINQKVDTSKMTAGTYQLNAYYQGTKVATLNDDSKLYIKVTDKDGKSKTYKTEIQFNNTWKDWYHAQVTDIVIPDGVKSVKVGTRMSVSGDGPWVVVDDISLFRTGD
ncbi:MAG: glycosyl hydrolase 53 family protein [Catonella sp.]|nr:glycosyl hydrolase 53 family protein [Catonella sp.]